MRRPTDRVRSFLVMVIVVPRWSHDGFYSRGPTNGGKVRDEMLSIWAQTQCREQHAWSRCWASLGTTPGDLGEPGMWM
jgi:hypothetical protein